ncbi:glycosyltransferase [Holdemania massiliensis]|uniref:glycosyltransferase n=1 Tax=Holdemania massiliensis TaxID=1468449 RepID=UPI003563C664
MKIQFVIPTLSSGGAERIVTNLANELSAKGHEVKIILLENKKPFYQLNERVCIQTTDIKVNRDNRICALLHISRNILFRLPSYIKKQTKEFSPDAIISFLPYADIAVYLSGIHRKGYKIVFSERNDPTRRSFFMRHLLEIIYTKGHALVCQSERVAEFYHSVEKNKKFVIPNSVVKENIPDEVAERSPLRIVAVGRLDTQKNFEMLIDSFCISYKRLPPKTSLTIYGEGPLRNVLQEKIKLKGMLESIYLPGVSKNLLNEIKDASLFIMSSNYEGFPNALLEAMTIGLPVISTNFWTGTAAELIDDENGRLVEVGNIEGLANAIVQIMNDDILRVKMRKENRKLLDKYASDRIIQKWCEIILS